LTAVENRVTTELKAVSDQVAALKSQPAADQGSQATLLAIVALVTGLGGLGLGALAMRRRG
jgi:hypothetical protein